MAMQDNSLSLEMSFRNIFLALLQGPPAAAVMERAAINEFGKKPARARTKASPDQAIIEEIDEAADISLSRRDKILPWN
jgi:hypothetical protein